MNEKSEGAGWIAYVVYSVLPGSVKLNTVHKRMQKWYKYNETTTHAYLRPITLDS